MPHTRFSELDKPVEWAEKPERFNNRKDWSHGPVPGPPQGQASQSNQNQKNVQRSSFSCGMCLRHFSTEGEYRAHNAEKKHFDCKICTGRAFQEEETLKWHYKVEHPGKKYGGV